MYITRFVVLVLSLLLAACSKIGPSKEAPASQIVNTQPPAYHIKADILCQSANRIYTFTGYVHRDIFSGNNRTSITAIIPTTGKRVTVMGQCCVEEL